MKVKKTLLIHYRAGNEKRKREYNLDENLTKLDKVFIITQTTNEVIEEIEI